MKIMVVVVGGVAGAAAVPLFTRVVCLLSVKSTTVIELVLSW